MASNRNNRRRNNSKGPFGVQRTPAARDCSDELLTIEHIERLRNLDDTRDVAFQYLHDPQAFASLWASTTIHPEFRRTMRKLVQIQTINTVNNGFYRLPDGQKVMLNRNRMRYAAENTQKYENDHLYTFSESGTSNETPTKIYVVNGDCLEATMAFKNADPQCHPVVLNMASANHPGGGWKNGCGAQEENLHRRTNLFQCLEDSYKDLTNTRDWSYPIPEFGGIYSPNVSVFRGAEVHGYPFFVNGPQYISFIACAAYSHPPTETDSNGEHRLSGTRFIANTKRKIEGIMKIAAENKHDVLILSAFGCGAFRNPPGHIAELFSEVIKREYSHKFKAIVFAIIDDHNAMKEHNPKGNVQPFADVFHVDMITVEKLAEILSTSHT